MVEQTDLVERLSPYHRGARKHPAPEAEEILVRLGQLGRRHSDRHSVCVDDLV